MPRKSDIESKLQTHIDSFVEEISALVREAAVEAVQEALLAGGGGAPAGRRKKAKAAKKGAGKRASKKAAKKFKGGRRVRRTAADLEKLGSRFLAHVKSHPGQRLEEIVAGLKIDTAELKRPVQLLLEGKKVRTEGQRRGTKYFVAGGGAKGGAKKKVAKKASEKKASKRAKAA